MFKNKMAVSRFNWLLYHNLMYCIDMLLMTLIRSKCTFYRKKHIKFPNKNQHN